jgi:hypothetical protein
MNGWKMQSGASEQPKDDTYFARVVGVVNLGHQPGFMYNGEMQDPQYKSEITYELVTTEMGDGRPFHISEEINMKNGKEANATKRANAMGTETGDFLGMLNKPVMVTTGLNKNGYAKVKAVASAPSGLEIAELRNNAYAFTMYDDNPDLEMYNNFSSFRKKKIESALDFEGTELHKRLLVEAVEDDL